MRNRELQLAVLLVLLGSALVLLAGGREWVAVVLPATPPLPPRSVTRAGGELTAALRPLGLLGLAGVAALAGTRGRGRRAVGGVLLLAGAGVVAATAGVLGRGAAAEVPQADGFTAWPLAALAGAALLALGGLLVLVRGRRWAALSGRYDAPAARNAAPAAPARPEVEAWDALDRGEDPTSQGPGPVPPPSDPAAR